MRTTKKKRRSSPKASAATLQRATPAFVKPMAAQVVKRLPEGDEWIYELKFDGYRAVVLKDHQQVQIRSRKNQDLTTMYPRIYNDTGLRFAGKVRAGFVPHLRRELAKALKPPRRPLLIHRSAELEVIPLGRRRDG